MNCGRYLFSATGCWLMKRCSTQRRSRRRCCSASRNSRIERLVLAVEHLQRHHLVGRDDLREADESGKAAAEIRVALQLFVVVCPVRRGRRGIARLLDVVRGIVRHLPDRVSVAIAADHDELPEGSLPRFNFGNQRVDVLFAGLSPMAANQVERRRRRFVGQGLPEGGKVLRIQLFDSRHFVELDPSRQKIVTAPHGGGEVRREWQAAICTELRIKLAKPGDALRGPFAPCLAGREAEAVRQQYRMIRDLLGRGEVLLQQSRRNIREPFSGVGESFAGGAVRRELARRPQIDAGQVTDRRIVLGIAEPPQRHVPRIAGPGAGFGIEHAAGPVDDLFTFGGRRLWLALRRHFPRFEHLNNLLPRLQVLATSAIAAKRSRSRLPFLASVEWQARQCVLTSACTAAKSAVCVGSVVAATSPIPAARTIALRT